MRSNFKKGDIVEVKALPPEFPGEPREFYKDGIGFRVRPGTECIVRRVEGNIMQVEMADGIILQPRPHDRFFDYPVKGWVLNNHVVKIHPLIQLARCVDDV